MKQTSYRTSNLTRIIRFRASDRERAKLMNTARKLRINQSDLLRTFIHFMSNVVEGLDREESSSKDR